MARIAVEFVGTGNFAPLIKQIESVNTSLASTSVEMNKLGAAGVTATNKLNATFKQQLDMMGGFSTHTGTVMNSTAKMTEMIQKQEVTWRNLGKAMKEVPNIAENQMRLQNSIGMKTAQRGMSLEQGMMISPAKSMASDLELANQKMKAYAGIADSVATNTIKMGKNMQWAGRQLTVGLSLPIIGLGLESVKAAREINASMVELLKVYGTIGSNGPAELDKVKKATMETAKEMADQYGFMEKDTVNLAATFAAMGYAGQQLQDVIKSTSRIMMIGDIDAETAAKGAQAIQSGWQLSTAQLADTFNRLNVIENQTVLTTKDILFAVPQAGAAVRQAGGSVEYMATMLAAMRDRGVAVGKATMAVRSGMADLAAPVAGATKAFDRINSTLGGTIGSLKEIIEKGKKNGGAQGIVESLAEAFAKMSKEQQNTAAVALFHKQEYTQWLNLIQEVNDAKAKGASADNAYALAQTAMTMSSTDAALIAAGEVQQQTESASGKFKILRAQINAELVKLGTPFLDIVNTIIGGVVKIAKTFNDMPGILKKVAVGFAIFGALVGPIVMLVGLFSNFWGQIAKGLISFTKLRLGIGEVKTEEQRFREVMDGTTTSVKNQEEAFILLTRAQMRHAEAMARQVELEKAAARTREIDSFINSKGGPNNVTRGEAAAEIDSRAEIERMRVQNDLAAHRIEQERLAGVTAEEGANKSRVAWTAVGRAVGLATAGLLMFGTSEGPVATAATTILTTLSLFPGVIGMIIKGIKTVIGAEMIASISGTFQKLTGSIVMMFRIVKVQAIAALEEIAAALTITTGGLYAILAGLTAAAVVAVALFKHNANEAKKHYEDTATAASDMAKAIGANYSDLTLSTKKATDAAKDHMKIIDEFKAKHPETVKSISDAYGRGRNVSAAVDVAKSMGIDMMQHGAGVKDAETAVRNLLESTGIAALKIPVELNFADKAADNKKHAEDMAKDMSKISQNKFGQGWWEGMTLPPGTLNANSKKEAIRFADNFTNSIVTGMNEDSARGELQQAAIDAENVMNEAYAKASKDHPLTLDKDATKGIKDAFKGIDVGNLQSVNTSLRMVAANMNGSGKAADDAYAAYMKLNKGTREYVDAISMTAQADKALTEQIMKKANISDKEFNAARGTAELHKYLAANYQTTAEAVSKYNEEVTRQTQIWGRDLNPAQLGDIANTIIQQGHYQQLTADMLMTGDAAKQTAADLAASTAAGVEWQNHIGNMTGQLKTQLEESTKDYIGMVDKSFDESTKAGERNLTELSTASGKHFDKMKNDADRAAKMQVQASNRVYTIRTTQLTREYQHQEKAIKKAYNVQINALNKQMAAEKVADAKRQALFQAEMTRIQRLGEAANASIDLNAALRVGNLDEAARIVNTQEVTADQNAATDANANQTSAAAARAEKKQAKVDSLSAQRDAELASAQKMYDTRKQDLADAKQHAADIINQTRDQAKARLDIEKQNAADLLATQKQAYTDQRAAQKTAMDDALATRATYATTTEGAYKANLDAINKIAKEKGDVNISTTKAAMDNYQHGWGVATTKALEAIAQNNEWGQFGQRITAQVVEGLTGDPGMTWDQFVQWMETGIKPKPEAATTGTTGGTNQANKNAAQASKYNHAGGPAGSTSGRAGRPLHHGLYPDEIPTVLQRGEYVIRREAVNNIGVQNLDALNNGKGVAGTKFFHQGGLVPALGMMMMRSLKEGIAARIKAGAVAADDRNIARGVDPSQTITGGTQAVSFSAIGPVVGFSPAQVQNAAAILSVGKAVGASQRDDIVALMTAMQESGLINLPGGDRDSVGLFQQRPSQGWGTVNQIMDPAYAARKFFEGLLGIQNRDNMKLTEEAQAVQRSADPGAYAKWETSSRALVSAIMSGVASNTKGQTYPEIERLALSGPPSRVTSTTGGGHAQNSYHYLGEAVDFGEPSGASMDSPGLLAINRFWAGLAAGLKEVIYSGPGAVNVKDGRLVDGNSVYGASTMAEHHNHVHVAATPDSLRNLGISIPGLRKGGVIMNDNTLANLHARETVLTAPLSRSLERGIQNMDNSSKSEYTINVHPSPGMDETALANKVAFVLQQKEMAKGVNRRLIGRER